MPPELAALWTKRDTDPTALEALVAHHWGLAITLVARHPLYRIREERDDLQTEALIGLYEAVLRFDPARGLQFSTFASHYIHGRIHEHNERFRFAGFSHGWFVQTSPLEREKALPYSLDHVSGVEGLRLLERTMGLAASPEAHSLREAIWQELLDLLPPQEWYAVLLCCRFGLTRQAAAAQLGVSKNRVCQLVNRAAQLLRERGWTC